jgi:1-acyl-sn-glycerol-3-phosphate acyltransferase
MRLGEIGPGPLFPAAGSPGERTFRRVRGVVLELLAFVLVTVLFPLLMVGALVADLVHKLRAGKPFVAIRLVPFLWWFTFTETWSFVVLGWIWISTGGPFGKGSMRRRRGVYWLRPRWAGAHLGGIKRLFGLRFEIEGAENALPGGYLMMIRHASIVDNMLPDTQVAKPMGLGIRYVVKRELEMLPLIDIGGRWLTTQFLERVSENPEREIGTMRRMTEDMGPAEAVLIYPEGTRATAKKIARAKEIIREKQPEIAPLAETMTNLLPPRLGGPLALLDSGEGMDVVFFAHVGFDGFEYISDIWAGGLNGATIRMKIWRVPASEIPADEQGRTEWLYSEWQAMDRWVGENLQDLDHTPASGKAAPYAPEERAEARAPGKTPA